MEGISTYACFEVDVSCRSGDYGGENREYESGELVGERLGEQLAWQRADNCTDLHIGVFSCCIRVQCNYLLKDCSVVHVPFIRSLIENLVLESVFIPDRTVRWPGSAACRPSAVYPFLLMNVWNIIRVCAWHLTKIHSPVFSSDEAAKVNQGRGRKVGLHFFRDIHHTHLVESRVAIHRNISSRMREERRLSNGRVS